MPFPIVGIGASAGGLEAFTHLLQHLPADTGMGLVLVQHLDPTHESELTQILARATTMPTTEVTNNLRVEPNHVYVIPPNVNLTIVGGMLKLEPRPKQRKPQHAIDYFFEALARDQRERAIGVILSGTATDGTIGLEAIKAEDGITFAQDASAKYDSMPHSAVAAGCVDFVLSPENIAQELARIAKHPFLAGSPYEAEAPEPFEGGSGEAGEGDRESSIAHQDDATALPSGGHGTPSDGAEQAHDESLHGKAPAADDGLKQILLLLRNHCGVDFSLYKSTTIRRRIARRTVLSQHTDLAQYARFLRGNKQELDTLFSDVLISVTSFFRNPEAFDVLKKVVFPKIFGPRRHEPVRVWVLGCSTGQEAYSIGMAFSEFSDKMAGAPKLQVFATDLNDRLLDKARAGLYAKSLAMDISAERLRRFFVEEDGGYRVIKSLRESVVFARHNLVGDPPFSRMDLICCRNVLIHLEPLLQKKALPTFHYALKPHGFLFLGASESVGQFTGLFEPVDRKHKIFASKPAETRPEQLLLRRSRQEEKRRLPVTVPSGLPESLRTELTAQREADRVVLNDYGPPGVLVNSDWEVVQFRGATTEYLNPPRGKASFDVLKMAHEGLMLPLRAALNKAKKENKAVRKVNLRVQVNGGSRAVSIHVIPLKNLKERSYLILFDEVATAGVDVGDTSVAPRRGRGPASLPVRANGSSTLKGALGAAGERALVKALRQRLGQAEHDLTETRDYLQTIQEQHDSANEELQASAEEAQSANEELQSINEELETSKEELESTNEELTTVNEEMGNRNHDLNRLNADLNNLHVSIHTAILVVGRDLAIRRFTPLAEKVFNLIAVDVGRPLGGIRHTLLASATVDPDGTTKTPSHPLDLEQLLKEVIDDVGVREIEVEDNRGHSYSMRLRPYLTLDNKIDGAVLALVDVDALKRSEREAEAALRYAEATLRTIRDPLVVLSGDLRVKTANEAFYKAFKVTRQATEGQMIYDLGDGQWNTPRLRTLLEDVLPRHSFFNDFEVTHEFPGVGRRSMLLNGRRVEREVGVPDLILLAIEDITDRKAAETAMRESESRFRTLFDSAPMAVYVCDVHGVIQAYNARAVKIWGREPKRGVEKFCGALQLLLPDGTHVLPEKSSAAEVLRTGTGVSNVDVLMEQPDGTRIPVIVSVAPLRDAEGAITGMVSSFIDITDRKQAEEGVRQNEERFRLLAETVPEKIFVADSSGEISYLNPQWFDFTGMELAQYSNGGWMQMVHPDDVTENLRLWQHAIATGEPLRIEHRIRRADGEFRWHLSQAVALRDAAGKVLMWVGSNADIHDVKESDRRKNEFLAMLAHELRSPLAPIRNALEILRKAPGDAETGKRAVAMMQRQVGQVVRLVDDLLDVSRISQGKISLRRERIELALVLNHAVEAARPHVESMEQVLTVTIPQQAVYLHADATRIVQIVSNLLSNASKFSDRGGEIRLAAEREDAQVVIRVQDSGIGIAAEQLPNLFEMFMQLDTSLERAQGGLGLGLTLVKNLVEKHDGIIEARSDGLGHGAEFVVRLPVLMEPSPVLPTPHGEPAVQQPMAAQRRILHVDDNLDAADSLAMLLRLSGYDVHCAHDGLEAVEAAARLQPDIILLDIGLPKISGYEAARRIRLARPGAGLVLVALTGWGQADDKRRSQEAGFDAHLVKPVDYAALESLLASLSASLSTNA